MTHKVVFDFSPRRRCSLYLQWKRQTIYHIVETACLKLVLLVEYAAQA